MLLVSLMKVYDKGIIFKNLKHLKRVKNNLDQSYFVSDQLTFEKQEEQRCFKLIKKMNSDLPVTDRRGGVTIKKGTLYIDNAAHKKKIEHPTPSDTIKPDSEQKIKDLYQTEGEIIRNGVCHFVAISQEGANLDDIRCSYIKV